MAVGSLRRLRTGRIQPYTGTGTGMQDITLLHLTGKDLRCRIGTVTSTHPQLGARPGHGDGRGRRGPLGSPESLPIWTPLPRPDAGPFPQVTVSSSSLARGRLRLKLPP